MKFIPQSLEAASRWVDVCEKSLGIDRVEIASMYANMCGFASWELMAATMMVERPSLPDEDIKEDVAENRHAFYKDVLVDTFFMNPCFADYLIHLASPSSKKEPSVFSVDESQIFFKANTDLPIPGRDMSRALNTYAKQFLVDDKLGKEVDLTKFSDRLRVHGNVFPGYWFNLLASIGWDLIEDSYVEEYSYSKPSMFVRSASLGNVPIYIVSLTKIPLDTTDSMAMKVLGHLKDDIENNQALKYGVVFGGSMQSKSIDGRWYTNPGMVFQDGEWKEFLINQHVNAIEIIFEMAKMLDINHPPEKYEDPNLELNRGFGYMKLDVDSPVKVEFNILSNPSGWINLIPTLKKF